MKTKEEILQEAIGTGELIKIKYFGGSQPGTVREIMPRKIDEEKDRIYAYCGIPDKVITFNLSKIEIASYDENITYCETQKDPGKKMPEADISILKNAIKTDKVIKIKYNSGSQPGAVREIVPKKIDEDYMEAHCIKAGEDLTFNMSYVELASESDAVDYLNRDNFYIFSRFQEKVKNLHDSKKENWKQRGWFVELNNSAIGIRFDGKEDGQADIFILFEGSREKPCIVQCKGKNTYFKDVDGAIKKFLEYCDNPSPTPTPVKQTIRTQTQNQPLNLVEEIETEKSGWLKWFIIAVAVIVLGYIFWEYILPVLALLFILILLVMSNKKGRKRKIF